MSRPAAFFLLSLDKCSSCQGPLPGSPALSLSLQSSHYSPQLSLDTLSIQPFMARTLASYTVIFPHTPTQYSVTQSPIP